MNLIKEFKEFVSSSTSSGKTKFIDKIWSDPLSAKSQSSSVLLRNKLKKLEDDEIRNVLGKIPDWALRKIKSNPEKYEKIKVTLNNLEFLKNKLKELGELYCEYCNKGPLVIYDFSASSLIDSLESPNMRINTKFNPNDGATCDHKQPQSKGGDKFNYSNLAVCCHRCNRKKGNIDYNDWIDFLKSDKGKDWLELGNTDVSKIKDKKIGIWAQAPNAGKRGVDRPGDSFKRKSRNYNESDFKVGDEVWIKGVKKKDNKYLGVISDIRINHKHPQKSLSASIVGKDPNSLFSLDRLCKFESR